MEALLLACSLNQDEAAHRTCGVWRNTSRGNKEDSKVMEALLQETITLKPMLKQNMILDMLKSVAKCGSRLAISRSQWVGLVMEPNKIIH